jgi:hypothetical protein
MNFSDFDPAAEVRIDGAVLTICFRFSDEAEALAAAEELIAAHARGEDVTITLSSPGGQAGALQ